MFKFLTQTICSVLLISCLVIPTHARATASELQNLQQQLRSLQKLYAGLLSLPTPTVLGSQVVTVNNDKELFDALTGVTGGETILLAPGIYSRIFISNDAYIQYSVGEYKKSGSAPKPTSVIRIMSANSSNRAIIRGIEFRQSNNWHIEGVSIFPTDKKTAVMLSGNNIKFLNNNISFGESGTWTPTQWLQTVGDAITVKGNNIEVGFNYLKNINFGIAVSGNNANIHHNYITDFAGDGMRGNGDNALVEHNYITNPVEADPTNHYDGFQSWSTGTDGKVGTGIVTGTTLRYNTIMYQTKPHPFRAQMQGIGMFDGQFKDWKIENNLVIVNHYHAISVYGAIDSVIQNNVALDALEGAPGPSWIRFFNHKNGITPQNSIIRNNFGNSALASSTGVTVENHTVVPFVNYINYFNNPAGGDFTPKNNAFPFTVGAVIDTAKLAPEPIFISGASSLSSGTSPAATSTPAVIPVGISVTDADADTIRDAIDNCVSISNTDQKNNDADTTGDACDSDDDNDSIADTEEKSGCIFDSRSQCGAGTSLTPDQDGDGILNTLDNCPNIVNQNQLNFDGDTKGDACDSDEDNDGLKDSTESAICIHFSTKTCGVSQEITSQVITKSVLTTDNLRVRATPGGEILGTQPRDTKGVADSSRKASNNGMEWIYVDFQNGPDGYVATSYITEAPQLTETQVLIKLLLEQLAVLRAALKVLLAQ